MIELKSLPRSTPDTLALVPLPDKESDGFGNGLALDALKTLHIFERLNLALDLLVAAFLTKDEVLYQRDVTCPVLKNFGLVRDEAYDFIAVQPDAGKLRWFLRFPALKV